MTGHEEAQRMLAVAGIDLKTLRGGSLRGHPKGIAFCSRELAAQVELHYSTVSGTGRHEKCKSRHKSWPQFHSSTPPHWMRSIEQKVN